MSMSPGCPVARRLLPSARVHLLPEVWGASRKTWLSRLRSIQALDSVSGETWRFEFRENNLFWLYIGFLTVCLWFQSMTSFPWWLIWDYPGVAAGSLEKLMENMYALVRSCWRWSCYFFYVHFFLVWRWGACAWPHRGWGWNSIWIWDRIEGSVEVLIPCTCGAEKGKPRCLLQMMPRRGLEYMSLSVVALMLKVVEDEAPFMGML